MRFILNGQPLTLNPDQVVRRLDGIAPENIQQYGVRVGGIAYPVKQAFEVASGVSRRDFTSNTARRHLEAMGFQILGQPQPRGGDIQPTASVAGSSNDPHGWPWEGHVQGLFAAYLHHQEWMLTGMADTASKARGVDLTAYKGTRKVGAEVKGWPSKAYADSRRAEETKKTQPSTQAGHWFSQALLKAVMLLDSHPDHESLMVLPDFPRYRDLAQRTKSGRAACDVHVVFVGPDGAVASDTWTP